MTGVINLGKPACLHPVVRPVANQGFAKVTAFDETQKVMCSCGAVMTIGELADQRVATNQKFQEEMQRLTMEAANAGKTSIEEVDYNRVARRFSVQQALVSDADRILTHERTKRLPVMEIFESFQGEGIMLGTPCTFVRLAGCNLACPWCDTKESWDATGHTLPEEGNGKRFVEPCTIEDIVSCVMDFGNKYIVITGGEPTIHAELHALAKALYDKGFAVGLETNGTGTAINQAPFFYFVAASPKPPEFYVHPDLQANEFKLVASEELTLDVVLLFVSNLMKLRYEGVLWLQPEAYDLEASTKRIEGYMTEIKERFGANAASFVRIGIQAHKHWGLK